MFRKLVTNSFRIYRADLSKICRNWVSLVVLGGLVLLPSLYAWINIYASWDPYGSTKGIEISIVNEDKGTSIQEKEVNIGKEVIASLKENKSLGWVFFEDREKAIEELNAGNVYATIIIPEDFSRKILTLLDRNPDKPELEYYVNEKINAIAPKITDKGATTIQHQITTSFIETVANELVEIMHSVGIELDKEYPTIEKLERVMRGLQEQFPNVESGLNDLIEKAENGKVVIDRQDKEVLQLQNIINKTVAFNTDIAEVLSEISTKPEQVIPEIKENLMITQAIFSDISQSTADLKEQIELNKPELINDINQTIIKLESGKKRLTELSQKASEIDKNMSSTVLSINEEMINTLDQYIETLEKLKKGLDREEAILSFLDQIETLNNKLAADMEKLRNVVEEMINAIDTQLATLQSIVDKIEEMNPQVTGEALQTNYLKAIEEMSNLVSEAKKGVSKYPNLFGNTIYILNDIENMLSNMKEAGVNGSSFIEESLNNLKVLGRNLSSSIGEIRTHLSVIKDSMLNQLVAIEELMDEAASRMNSLKQVVSSVASGGRERIDQICKNINKVQERLDDVSHRIVNSSHEEVDRIEERIKSIQKSLTELEVNLQKVSDVIEDQTGLEEILQNTSQLTLNIQASLGNVIDLLDNDLILSLKEKLGKASVFVEDINGLLNSINNELNSLRDFGNRLGNQGEVLVSDMNEAKEHLPKLQSDIDKVVDKINLLNDKVDVKGLIKEMTLDNSEKSDFLAAPVILNTHKLYPMANYGAAMTPFYTTLCLWVGALLLCALLSTRSKNTTFECTPVEEYFGKYLLFATLAVLQGFIAAMGDIVVLGVQMEEPALFVLLAMSYSLIFTAIVYTLVALFGNVGKAIGVVLLVLQLAGSGGTFPIQVTPTFFQKIYELLPFTYGISAMREAIAGVYYKTLAKDFIVLWLFFVVALCIGALLKKKANAFLHRFSKKLGESGVIEH